ncbi:MAG: hypothetical protein AAGA29_13840 [Planctomycetota bacterium]
MHRGFLSSLIGFAWLGAGVVGCASGPCEQTESAASSEIELPSVVARQIASYELQRDDYDAAFDAAIALLRDQGFRIARKDWRFGVITTYPEASPTMFEPWVEGNAIRDLARRSTLNELRRRVTVTVKPATPIFEVDESLSGSRPSDPAARSMPETYSLSITVTLERRQAPDRYLTHSARGRIAARYRDVPAHLAQRGIPAEYWEAAGDDLAYAEHLFQQLAQRSDIAFDPKYSAVDP